MSSPSLRTLYTWPGNPSVDLLNRDGDAWTYSMGLLPVAADPDEWAAIGLADCTAWCYPFAAEDELFLAYHLYAWMFALDLLFPRTFKAERDLTGARAMVDRLSLFMPLEGTSHAIPDHPIERSLADLWLRMTPTRSTTWKRNMLNAVLEYADGQCWELECMCDGRVPDPAEYLVRRRGSFGGHVGICLAEHVAAAEVPARAPLPSVPCTDGCLDGSSNSLQRRPLLPPRGRARRRDVQLRPRLLEVLGHLRRRGRYGGHPTACGQAVGVRAP